MAVTSAFSDLFWIPGYPQESASYDPGGTASLLPQDFRFKQTLSYLLGVLDLGASCNLQNKFEGFGSLQDQPSIILHRLIDQR